MGAGWRSAGVAYFHVESQQSGYVVKPLSRPRGATAHALRTRPQSSAPRPGPTLAIQVARASRFRSASLAVRLVPVKDAAEAEAAAQRL